MVMTPSITSMISDDSSDFLTVPTELGLPKSNLFTTDWLVKLVTPLSTALKKLSWFAVNDSKSC